jgi:hypothetical protein
MGPIWPEQGLGSVPPASERLESTTGPKILAPGFLFLASADLAATSKPAISPIRLTTDSHGARRPGSPRNWLRQAAGDAPLRGWRRRRRGGVRKCTWKSSTTTTSCCCRANAAWKAAASAMPASRWVAAASAAGGARQHEDGGGRAHLPLAGAKRLLLRDAPLRPGQRGLRPRMRAAGTYRLDLAGRQSAGRATVDRSLRRSWAPTTSPSTSPTATPTACAT